jgi:drug/metabolite transporter (DMT)-like permease
MLKNKDKITALTLIISCTVFTSLGQIFWKLGADKLVMDFLGIITNFELILGFVFYGIGLILLIKALKFGDLSFVYPFIALSFVWVALLSHFFINEAITGIKLFAIAFIVAGVGLISAGKHRGVSSES